MKLQQTTWILLVLALGLGGFVYFQEIQAQKEREAVQQAQNKVFDFTEKQVLSLTIEKQKQTLKFERSNNEKTTWQMKQPNDVPADDASVAFLLNLLAEGKSDRSFTITAKQRKDYGLDQPLATVKVQLENKENHELILGKPDFNDQFLYAQADPSSEKEQDLKVILVPKDFQYAVERKLEEWKQKKETSEKIDSRKKLVTQEK